MESEFEKRLSALINEYSKENESDTPDFILARYLNAVLDNFNAAVKDREQWYGRQQHIEDNLNYKIPFTDGDIGVTYNIGIDTTTNIPSADYNDNVFIGYAANGRNTVSGDVFIGRNASNSNFSPDLTQAIEELYQEGLRLQEKINKLKNS